MQMEVSNEDHVPATLSLGNDSVTYGVGGRDLLGLLEDRRD